MQVSGTVQDKSNKQPPDSFVDISAVLYIFLDEILHDC